MREQRPEVVRDDDHAVGAAQQRALARFVEPADGVAQDRDLALQDRPRADGQHVLKPVHHARADGARGGLDGRERVERRVAGQHHVRPKGAHALRGGEAVRLLGAAACHESEQRPRALLDGARLDGVGLERRRVCGAPREGSLRRHIGRRVAVADRVSAARQLARELDSEGVTGVIVDVEAHYGRGDT